MKQKLGFLCTVLLLSCLLAAPSFAEDAEEEVPVGTRLGSVYTTDIVTYIDGGPPLPPTTSAGPPLFR